MSKKIRIALIGYGKMGKAIEAIALDRGHEIALRIDENNLADFTKENLSKADVAIEFTSPHTAFENLEKMIGWNVPVVCGTTGWTERLDEIKKHCLDANGSFIYTSNFSVGVNIFFELNKKLASLMAAHTEYSIELEETHHTTKKDAPSGTAISLADQIITLNPVKKKWINQPGEKAEELSIISKRIDPAAGTHVVRYSSPVDDIEIIHTAHSRQGFATGAVLAAEFIHDKKGVFTMKDVLNL